MPFLDSPIIRPLYDVHAGGQPMGFRCMYSKNDKEYNDPIKTADMQVSLIECSRVTRTLAGMRTHQRIVHGIKQQQEFNFETVLPTREDNDL